MKQPDDATRVRHIIDAAAKVLRWTRGKTRTDFAADEQLQAAVLYEIQIVGEAASRLSQDFRDSRDDIPWPRITGMRHIIVHAYMHVDIEIVWQVVTERLPPLLDVLRKTIPPDRS